MELMKIKMILFKIINEFSNIKKHLANFECIHTEHLALDELNSLCTVISIVVIESRIF